MTDSEEYNGSAEILGKLSDVLKDDKTIPPKVGMRLMIESQIHQIKAMHALKNRVSLVEVDVEKIQKDGVKPSVKSAFQYFGFFYIMDRSGIIDLGLNWLKTEGGLLLKLLFGI